MERRGQEPEEGQEQTRQLCNGRGRKTRERGLTLKDKWSQGLTHPQQVWLLLQGSTPYPKGTNVDLICILALFNKTWGQYSYKESQPTSAAQRVIKNSNLAAGVDGKFYNQIIRGLTV